MAHAEGPILILGGGGFAREVLWLMEEAGMATRIAGFVSPKAPSVIHGYDCWTSDEEALEAFPAGTLFVAAIGSGALRAGVFAKYISHGWKPQTVIHPAASVSRHSHIGEGSIVCAGARISTDTRLGMGCIVNLNACIGHDSILGDFVTLHPGCKVNGSCAVGNQSEIGTLAGLLPGITVGAGTVVGMGAMVIDSLPDSVMAVGVPAKIIRIL